MQLNTISEPRWVRSLFGSTKLAGLWLVIRLYVGWEWFEAGWEKVNNPVWVGPQAGVAVKGFLMGALQKTTGLHPDVQSWYAWLINHVALPSTGLISYLVAYGEVLVGVMLILGLFTALAAFLGGVMNFNYLFAGTVSVNPELLLLQILLILAWKTSGWYGLDRLALPRIAKWRR